ncbi:MAG: hypothetical protein DWQ36_06535 [Acidobacteria bacterium]|nr:MAG: hypothetical protein DWQ30_08445 [Acidobacteriota bacterium]REK09511.1 MAG: hypothetical protein DWQ36_06535 [Acidobacteriota bacterium]
MNSPTPRPDLCPVCGSDNDCGMVRGDARCWCFDRSIPAEALAAIPPSARGTVCICERCAGRRQDEPGSSEPPMGSAPRRPG